MTTTNVPRSGSQAVERAVSVLACFDGGPDTIGLSSLAHRSGLPVSTTYRIASALVRGRMLERDGGDGYRIGSGLLSLAAPSFTRMGVDRFAPTLHALAGEIRATVNLGTAGTSGVLTVYSARPSGAGPHPAAARVLSENAMRRVVLAFGARRDAPAVDTLAVRRLGYAVVTGPDRRSVSVAVPIIDATQRPWGALGVCGSQDVLSGESIRRAAVAMTRAARHIGRLRRPE